MKPSVAIRPTPSPLLTTGCSSNFSTLELPSHSDGVATGGSTHMALLQRAQKAESECATLRRRVEQLESELTKVSGELLLTREYDPFYYIIPPLLLPPPVYRKYQREVDLLTDYAVLFRESSSHKGDVLPSASSDQLQTGSAVTAQYRRLGRQIQQLREENAFLRQRLAGQRRDLGPVA